MKTYRKGKHVRFQWTHPDDSTTSKTIVGGTILLIDKQFNLYTIKLDDNASRLLGIKVVHIEGHQIL